MSREPTGTTLFPNPKLFGSGRHRGPGRPEERRRDRAAEKRQLPVRPGDVERGEGDPEPPDGRLPLAPDVEHPSVEGHGDGEDRKSTRLNSSHANTSYAVFCL